MTAHAEDDPLFLPALLAACTRLGCKAEDLLSVMASESGLDPSARNPHALATGLIQFDCGDGHGNLKLPDGTVRAPADVAALSASEQVPLVEAYFKPYRGKLTSAARIYAITFLPAVGASPSFSFAGTICGSRPGDPYPWAYKANPTFDVQRKGYITGLDMAQAATRATARLGNRWQLILAALAQARQDADTGPELPPSAA